MNDVNYYDHYPGQHLWLAREHELRILAVSSSTSFFRRRHCLRRHPRRRRHRRCHRPQLISGLMCSCNEIKPIMSS